MNGRMLRDECSLKVFFMIGDGVARSAEQKWYAKKFLWKNF